MKQLDDVMTELYAAKKKNASTHKDVASYLKFIHQQEKIRTKATPSRLIKSNASK
jgi:hypothetical protein